eukprot:1030334-Pelagomonas_calceolata.AAC.2
MYEMQALITVTMDNVTLEVQRLVNTQANILTAGTGCATANAAPPLSMTLSCQTCNLLPHPHDFHTTDSCVHPVPMYQS